MLRDTFSKVHDVEARIAAATATTMLTAVSVSLQIRLVGSYSDTDDEPVREYFRTRSLETDRTPLVQAHRAVERFDGRTTPDRIRTSTLVLVGDEDPDWFVRTLGDHVDPGTNPKPGGGR